MDLEASSPLYEGKRVPTPASWLAIPWRQVRRLRHLAVLLLFLGLVSWLMFFLAAPHMTRALARQSMQWRSGNSTHFTFRKPMRVVFGGPGKGVADALEKDTSVFYALAKQLDLADFRIFYFYTPTGDNDAGVKTLEKLRAADPVHFMYELDTQSSHGSRTDSLSVARNAMIHKIQTDLPDFDYFYHVDLDDCFPQRIVEYSAYFVKWMQQTNWDVLTFNRNFYYDIWALRTKEFPLNVWGPRGGADLSTKTRLHYQPILDNLAPEEWLPVDSAFGGFGIYRMSKTIDCHYSGTDENGLMDCEHVAFHRDMMTKHGAKIFISSLLMGPA